MNVPAFLLLQSVMSAMRRNDQARSQQHAQAAAMAIANERQRATRSEAAPLGLPFGHFVIDTHDHGEATP